MQSLSGNRIDKYDVIEEVGHGGMAVVYRGLDSVLEREVAIKVLHAHLAGREESRLRLQREALTVAKLRHDNIVEIFDYSGEDTDESYIVTEFIHGRTLREWLDSRWNPHPVIAALLVHRLCLPLIHAHQLGIVHRDIKPENVMIRQDGCLKLMDFGIAQILDHQKLTMTGQLLGSPAYMAPELISGKPIDARTDLFAVGIMLYQLATGSLPFAGRNPHEVLNRIADAQYTKATDVCPLVDESLEAIIEKALARNPEDRFQSARAFANELEDYLSELDIEPEPILIRDYFDNSDAFIDELDTQICKVLLDKAETATTDGNGARALRLLGRVLELDPENTRAQSMLDRARVRGQRMRQLLVGGASLALVGLVAAGWMMMKPEPAMGEALPGTDDPRTTMTGAVEIPDEPSALPAVGTDAESQGATEAGATEAAGTEAGSTEAEADGSTDSPAAAIAGKSLTIRPNRRTNCTIDIVGMPPAAMEHYQVSVTGVGKLNIDRGSRAVSFDIKRDTEATLIGKSSKGSAYGGRTGVRMGECKKGHLKLRASPKPAKLDIRSNVNTAQLTVICKKGCEKLAGAGASKSAKRYPGIPSPNGDNREWTIVLEFKAPGFRKKVSKYRVSPGPQQITAELEPVRG
jgi:serine/threonine-protein kinase